jgi:hypothetical protein
VKRLATAVLVATLLTLTAACEAGIPAGTVTSKGVVNNTSNNSKCYWISVRHDNGGKTKGCIALAKWRKVAKGDHWSGQ